METSFKVFEEPASHPWISLYFICYAHSGSLFICHHQTTSLCPLAFTYVIDFWKLYMYVGYTISEFHSVIV